MAHQHTPLRKHKNGFHFSEPIYHSVDPLNPQGIGFDEDKLDSSGSNSEESFIVQFAKASGPPQTIILVLILATGLGSTVAIIPAVMTDRYARLNFGYTGEGGCSDYTISDKPQACYDGSAHAQNAVAIAQFVSNGLQFLSGSLIGALSDQYGRRIIILVGLSLCSLSPLCLVMIQVRTEMSPVWYYGISAFSTPSTWLMALFSSLADVMAPKWRAASFGMVLAAFSLGISIAPTISLTTNHLGASVMSVLLYFLGLVFAAFFFPETLSPETSTQTAIIRNEQMENINTMLWYLYRPLWELSILNRNRLFRVLSLLALITGIAMAAEHTLLIYYLEERLDFNDNDVAQLYLIMGSLGIIVQGLLLKSLNALMGERCIVIVAFLFGALNNACFGLAKSKFVIFVGVALSSFMTMAFPTLAAIQANNVEHSEHGRIQGAMRSVNAVAHGIGPLLLRSVYHKTKNSHPGTMFLFTSVLLCISMSLSCAIPKNAANPEHKTNRNTCNDPDCKNEPSLI